MNSENLIVLRKEDSHLVQDSVSNAVCFEEWDELVHFFFLWLLVTCYALSIYSRSSLVKYFLENFLDVFRTANIVPKVFSLCPSDGGFAGKYVASKSLCDIDLRIPGVVFSVHPKILSVLVKRPG